MRRRGSAGIITPERDGPVLCRSAGFARDGTSTPLAGRAGVFNEVDEGTAAFKISSTDVTGRGFTRALVSGSNQTAIPKTGAWCPGRTCRAFRGTTTAIVYLRIGEIATTLHACEGT